MATTTVVERTQRDVHSAVLWLGLLAPPLLTLLNLQLGYMSSPFVCRTNMQWVTNTATAVILSTVILTGVAAALRGNRDWLADRIATRASFMAMLGVFESILFTVVIIAQWLPNAFLSPCQ